MYMSSPFLCTFLSSIFIYFGIVPQINSQTVRRKVYLYEGTIRVYLFLIVPQIKSLSWYMHIKEQHERSPAAIAGYLFLTKVPAAGPRRSPAALAGVLSGALSGQGPGSFGIVPPKQIPFVTEWGSPWDEASKVGGLSTSDQPILALDLPVYGEYIYYPCCSYRFDQEIHPCPITFSAVPSLTLTPKSTN